MNDYKDITKPATLIKEEFVQDLVNLCNNSKLPFFVIEYALNDLLKDVHAAAQKQLESDRAKYNQKVADLDLQSIPIVEGDEEKCDT